MAALQCSRKCPCNKRLTCGWGVRWCGRGSQVWRKDGSTQGRDHVKPLVPTGARAVFVATIQIRLIQAQVPSCGIGIDFKLLLDGKRWLAAS